jgi:hypothetical protein
MSGARIFGALTVLFLGAAAVMQLSGCEAKLHVTSKSSGDPVTIQVPQVNGPSSTLSISEMCYDGVKYLVNNKGGMAAKVSRSVEGTFRLTGC